MELLKKLSQIISKIVPAGLSEKEVQLVADLNPDKFYVENVRSILGVSYTNAQRICETAVRQGVFERRVEVKCPDGAVAASADIEAHLPKTVRCWMQEGSHFEPVELPTRDLEKSVFYRLHDRSTSAAYTQTA